MLKKKYTAEEKYCAIAECRKSSIHAVSRQNGIETTQLREWIKKYNSHENLKATSSEREIFMTKGRTVTFEEKVEIVEFCLSSGKDYGVTLEKFKVSYQLNFQCMIIFLKFAQC